MSRILPAGGAESLAAAAAALAGGGVVVIPTDTVYGVAARTDRPQPLQALFALKGRPASMALPVLAADAAQAGTVGRLVGTAEALARAFWPGPLTIVVERAAGVTADLGGDGATVGLRVPALPAVLALLRHTGPLATTSANPTGQPTPTTAAAIEAIFGERVAVYLDGGPAPGGTASTVVSVVKDELRVLREGPVTLTQLLQAARGSGAR